MAVEVLDPQPQIPIKGRFAPAGPILELEMEFPSFPVVVPVLKKMVPPLVKLSVVEDPKIVQFVTVLLVASFINLIVLVPAIAEVERFDIVSALPPVFNPLMVTLSAPFKLIKDAATFPRATLSRGCRQSKSPGGDRPAFHRFACRSIARTICRALVVASRVRHATDDRPYCAPSGHGRGLRDAPAKSGQRCKCDSWYARCS